MSANKRFGKMIAAAMTAAVLVSPARATIVHTLHTKGDGYVRSSAEKKGYGFETHLELRMSAQAGAAEGYLQFALPQHAPFAEKILLRLHAQLTEPGDAKVLVRSVSAASWTELGLTWRTRPEHKFTLGTISIVGLSGAWYEVDVTDFVKAEAALGRESVNFALVPEETKNRILISTREHAQKKPELVFSREPIVARINFLPTNAVPVEGYIADFGEAFGPRTNGLTYGWSVDNRGFMRDRASRHYKRDKNPPIKTADRRYDFLAYMDNEKMKAPVSWEMALPNGTYRVRVVAGDSFKFDSIFGLLAEDVKIIDGVPDSNKRWLDNTANITVKDGRLTIANAPDSSNNKLSFIEITEDENLLTQTR